MLSVSNIIAIYPPTMSAYIFNYCIVITLTMRACDHVASLISLRNTQHNTRILFAAKQNQNNNSLT